MGWWPKGLHESVRLIAGLAEVPKPIPSDWTLATIAWPNCSCLPHVWVGLESRLPIPPSGGEGGTFAAAESVSGPSLGTEKAMTHGSQHASMGFRRGTRRAALDGSVRGAPSVDAPEASSGLLKALLRSGAPKGDCRSAVRDALDARLSATRSIFDAAKVSPEYLAVVEIIRGEAPSYPRPG